MIPLDADGNCSVCDNAAGNAYVSCFLCCNKFHAFGCTSPANSNICNTSFLSLFRPMNEKTGVNSGRPGNFLFFCDLCMTKFETDQAMKMEDRLTLLQNQMKLMFDDIHAMKESTAISKANSKNSPLTFAEVMSNEASTIGDTKGTIGYPRAPIDTQTHTTEGKSVQNPVLVIDEFDNDVLEKENMARVEQVVISNKIPIIDCYKNRSGKTVIVCESNEQRSNLKTCISESLPELPIRTPHILNKTITVAGFNPSYNDNILQTIISQNQFVIDFLALYPNNDDANDFGNHVKVLFVKPLKNNSSLSQVVFKVSSRFRELVKNHGDRFLVGMKGCPVYDRFFVKRCFSCQKYGHIHSKCPTPTKKVCAACSGEHDTRDCPNKTSPQCNNCKEENLDSNHHASSTACPIFQRELQKMKNTT